METQLEIDFTEFLLAHSLFLQELNDVSHTIPDGMDYFFEEGLEDYKVKKVKEFLIEHFPDKLDEIQIVVNYEFIRRLNYGT